MSGDVTETSWELERIRRAVFGKEFGFHSEHKERPKYHLAEANQKPIKVK